AYCPIQPIGGREVEQDNGLSTTEPSRISKDTGRKSDAVIGAAAAAKYSFIADDFDKSQTGALVIAGFGYSNRMLSIPKGEQVSLVFAHDAPDSLIVDVRL